MNQYIENIIQDAIFVPNSWLPTEFQNYRDGGRTLAELEKLCDKRDKITEHTKKKDEKSKRVEMYAKQFEQEGKFDYVDIDGHSQYNHEMAFAKYCPAIDLEELEENLLDEINTKTRSRFQKKSILSANPKSRRTYRQENSCDRLVEVNAKTYKVIK